MRNRRLSFAFVLVALTLAQVSAGGSRNREDEPSKFTAINGTDRENPFGEPARTVYVFELEGRGGCEQTDYSHSISPGRQKTFTIPAGEVYTYFIGYSSDACDFKWLKVFKGNGGRWREEFR